MLSVGLLGMLMQGSERSFSTYKLSLAQDDTKFIVPICALLGFSMQADGYSPYRVYAGALGDYWISLPLYSWPTSG